MAKYARIFMTGFRSAPINPEVLAELSNNQISYKIFPLNKMKVRNISLFAEYTLTDPNIPLSGIDTVYNSFYSGDLYARITGFGEFYDEGETNGSGIYIASGFHTGIFSGGQVFYDSKNRQVYPINQSIQFISSENVKYSADLTGITGENLNPANFKLQKVTGTISPAITNRNNSYTGIYSGITILADNFYDPNTLTVSFFKNYNYTVTGNSFWNVVFDVVNPVANSINEYPGIFLLNKIMNEGSGYAITTKTIITSGNISNVKLARKNLTGYAELTGLLTGKVFQGNSGIYIFNQTVTGNVISARQNIPTGFQNSYNFLNFNSPEEFDFITIDDPNLDIVSTFTYATGTLFAPPLYFDTLNTLNNIINSGNGSYGITSEIIGGKLKITSTTSGESGNLISIESFGSATKPFFDIPNFLQSGVSYYESLTPTGIFSGHIYSIIPATGLISTGYADFVTGNLTGVLGFKPFTGTWNLYLSDNNVSYLLANTFPQFVSETGIKYTTNFLEDPVINLYNIKVQYINPNDNIFNDVSELKIKLNNSETINIVLTGVQ